MAQYRIIANGSALQVNDNLIIAGPSISADILYPNEIELRQEGIILLRMYYQDIISIGSNIYNGNTTLDIKFQDLEDLIGIISNSGGSGLSIGAPVMGAVGGNILYAYTDELSTLQQIEQGTFGQVLSSNGDGSYQFIDASGTGTVTNVSGIGSITGTITTTGSLELVNDNNTPGISKYYGTDSEGTKGFFSIPGANTALSNLASTAVNVDILPGIGATVNLGSSTLPYKTIQFQDGRGSASDPDICWLDTTHGNTHTGFYSKSQALWITVQDQNCVKIEANGGTPYLVTGVISNAIISNLFGGTFELSGIEAVSDTSSPSGSNPAHVLIGSPQSGESSPQYGTALSSVLTSNNSVTLVNTFIVASNSSVCLEQKIVGRRSGGSAGTANDSAVIKITSMWKNVSGIATQVEVEDVYIACDNSNINYSFTVSGTQVQLNIIGDTNNNYSWKCYSHINFVN